MIQPLLRISRPLLPTNVVYRSLSTTSIYLAPKKQQQQQQSPPSASSIKKLKDEKVPGQVLMPDISSSNNESISGNNGGEEGETAGIPSEPSNYSTPSSTQSSPSSSSPHFDTTTPSESSAPKISTAAGLETHLSGGPTSGLSGDDVQQGEKGDGRESLNSKDDISRSGEEGKEDGRRSELNSDEKRGLIVLAGIILGGLTLGGVTRPRSRLNVKIEERETGGGKKK